MLTWMGFVSFHPINTPTILETVDAGEIQHWVRPPMESDLGLSATILAIRSHPPGPIWVENPPDIPGAVQTTENWVLHLIPYLKREGMNEDTWPVYIRFNEDFFEHRNGYFQPTNDDDVPVTHPQTQVVWGAIPADVQVPELRTGFQVLHE